MKKEILFLAVMLFSGVLLFSCGDDDGGSDNNDIVLVPNAGFMVSDSIIREGMSVQFTDLSSNGPDTWSWTFEGGTPGTSNEQNPTVSYETSGRYNATLTVSNAGGENAATKTDFMVVVPTDGLVAYYPLDGDTQDQSGNEYHATNNNVEFGADIAGNAGQAANFAQSGAFLEVNSNEGLNFGTNDFSISLWIRPDSSQTQMVFQKGGLNSGDDPQYWLRLNDASGDITFLTGDGMPPSVLTSSDTSTITNNRWRHLVVQRLGQRLEIYLDNTLVSAVEDEAQKVSSSQSLKFGLQVLSFENINQYYGAMDEIRIYNETLSLEEIDILYSTR